LFSCRNAWQSRQLFLKTNLLNYKTKKMKVFNLIGENNKPLTNCKVIENDGLSQLLSYNTIVAEYNHETNEMDVKGYYSMTTAKHINAFLDFYGFDRCNKTQLLNYKN
jgi:hypothetical protein